MPQASDVSVRLSDGRSLTIRAPCAGDLRGVKLLDLLQLDTAAMAPVVERLSELTVAEFYALSAVDAMSIMTEVVGFFAPSATVVSPPPSTTG